MAGCETPDCFLVYHPERRKWLSTTGEWTTDRFEAQTFPTWKAAQQVVERQEDAKHLYVTRRSPLLGTDGRTGGR